MTHANFVPSARQPEICDRTQFRNQVRDALAHLYDTAHLECHPLVAQLIKPNASSRLTRAQMLRSLLKEAIEALRPPQDSPSSAPEWRSYLALHHRYVKGSSLQDTQDELGLSRRQLQRELRKGIDALAVMLWERRIPNVEHPIRARSGQPGEVELLRQELDRWEASRQACTVQTLVDDTRWMLGPLTSQAGTRLRVDLPPSADPVFVDPTLTRQAMFRVLRLLAQSAGESQISIQATRSANAMDIIFQRKGASIAQEEEDWEIAGLLVRRQGGTLRQEVVPDIGPRVVMSLPLASRARVLVIDDVEAAHRLLERYLSPHNYEVTGTSSTSEALRLSEKLHPDLIILDVMMPTMDGWQVLRELQGNPATTNIPVVVCSVLDEPELALSLGARAFVKKPVNRLELLNTLERVRGSTAPSGAMSPEATADS